MSRTIPFAQYIFKRLQQVNCHSVHGVPGDFLLRALDHARPCGMKWIGNANELCAGYAADGYARAGSQLARRRKDTSGRATVGALWSTYGVGELSAINAVAGSYAESVPVVHLVATPSREAMRTGTSRRPIHHSLGDGQMDVYANMAKQVTCAQAYLHKLDKASDVVGAYDEVLEQAVLKSKPVYASVASDMMEMDVPVDALNSPLHLEASGEEGQDASNALIEQLSTMMVKAERPLIIADGLSYPFHLVEEINELVSLTGIPAMSYTSGKGVVDESLPSWDPALPNTTDYSRAADLVMIFGPLLSDTNTARWTAIPDAKRTVLFNLDSIEVGDRMYDGVRSKTVLRKLSERLRNTPLARTGSAPVSKARGDVSLQTSLSSNRRITQDGFWPLMTSFLRPDDTLLLANGTPLIGGRALHLERRNQVIASSIWCSIGSMLPAAQGVAAAKKDHSLPGRTILFEGDGSFQVTCQSISDIIRNKLDVTIFIINNFGYTYERWLNGMEADYNDVPSWRYTEAARFFGASENDASYPLFSRTVQTWPELHEVLSDERASDARGLKIIDVRMEPQDVPEGSKAGLRQASEALQAR